MRQTRASLRVVLFHANLRPSSAVHLDLQGVPSAKRLLPANVQEKVRKYMLRGFLSVCLRRA